MNGLKCMALTTLQDQLVYRTWSYDSGNALHSSLLVVRRMGQLARDDRYFLPSKLAVHVGQRFVDVLHPKNEAAEITLSENGTLLLHVPTWKSDSDRTFISALADSVENDGDSTWAICAGANLEPLSENTCDGGTLPLWKTWAALFFYVAMVCVVLLRNSRSSVVLSVVTHPTTPTACSADQ